MSEAPQEHGPALNTDRELWRERPGDYYADSIHVTEGGGIGINCGGLVFVKPIREWHALAKAQQPPTPGDAVNVGVRVAAGAGDPPAPRCDYCERPMLLTWVCDDGHPVIWRPAGAGDRLPAPRETAMGMLEAALRGLACRCHGDDEGHDAANHLTPGEREIFETLRAVRPTPRAAPTGKPETPSDSEGRNATRASHVALLRAAIEKYLAAPRGKFTGHVYAKEEARRGLRAALAATAEFGAASPAAAPPQESK